jgi:hypothetical protein
MNIGRAKFTDEKMNHCSGLYLLSGDGVLRRNLAGNSRHWPDLFRPLVRGR